MPLPERWPNAWGAPRLLTRQQLRGYLQIDEAELGERIRKGQVPKPLWGCDQTLPSARWDREAVDRALSRASAIPASVDAAIEALDDACGYARA